MINWFQTLMYKVSCVAPIMIVIGFSLWIQGESKAWCVALIGIGTAVSCYAPLFIKLCKDKLPLLPVTLETIASNDSIAFMYVVTYFVPLTGIIWKDKQWIWVVIACIAILVLLKINTLSFSLPLLFLGYHCYKVTLTTGMSECFVISRRQRITNKNQIQVVQRINSFLLIDEGGR